MKKKLIIKIVSSFALYTLGLLLILHLKLWIVYTIILIVAWFSVSVYLFEKAVFNEISKERKNELHRVKENIANHTIFNFINIISYLCRKDPEKARESLVHLSNYLRKCFKIEESFWSVEEEISFVESYLFMQAMRFRDKMNIEYVLNSSSEKIEVYSIFNNVKNYVETSYKEGYKNFNLLIDSNNIIINRTSNSGMEENVKINV